MYKLKGRPSQSASSNHNYKHGGKGTKLYNVWKGIRRRCNNLNNKYYGGKGIAVCEDWNNFDVFGSWAIEHGYKDMQVKIY